MARERLLPLKEREIRAQLRVNKGKNQGKSWATLNTNDKFEIIGDDLIARGIIDA